jgi:hypothetical protein
VHEFCVEEGWEFVFPHPLPLSLKERGAQALSDWLIFKGSLYLGW